MAAKSPRLSVSISPSLSALLAQLAHESEQSASSLVRELLEQSEPALGRLLQLLQAAKSAKGQVGAGVAGALDRVVGDLEEALAVADLRVGRATRDLVTVAESVNGRRRPAAGMRRGAPSGGPEVLPSTPVPVTRGSGGGKPAKTSNRRPGRGRAV